MVRVPKAHKPQIDPARLPPIRQSTVRRIATAMWPYRRMGVGVVGLMVGAALLHLTPPLLIKRVVDHAIPEGDTRGLLWLCAWMIAGPLGAGLLGVWQRYLSALIGERVMFDLRLALFKHLHKQPLGYFAAA